MLLSDETLEKLIRIADFAVRMAEGEQEKFKQEMERRQLEWETNSAKKIAELFELHYIDRNQNG
jgi:hypothetical protein